MAQGGIPLDQWSGSAATKDLERTVVALSESSERQTRHIIRLTYAMLFLTFVMACMVGVQIWIAIKDAKSVTSIETTINTLPKEAEEDNTHQDLTVQMKSKETIEEEKTEKASHEN